MNCKTLTVLVLAIGCYLATDFSQTESLRLDNGFYKSVNRDQDEVQSLSLADGRRQKIQVHSYRNDGLAVNL